jgi:hypothetical protein
MIDLVEFEINYDLALRMVVMIAVLWGVAGYLIYNDYKDRKGDDDE